MPVEQQAMPAEQAIASRELMPADKRLPAESKRRKRKICPLFYRRLAAKKSFIKAAHSSASSPFTTTVFG